MVVAVTNNTNPNTMIKIAETVFNKKLTTVATTAHTENVQTAASGIKQN